MRRFSLISFALVAWAGAAQQCAAVVCLDGQTRPVCFYHGNDVGFYQWFQGGTTIGFATLPDGTPSHAGVAITPSFNYTAQGATFSSPLAPPYYPYIAGNATTGWDLEVYSGNTSVHDWIIADLTQPAEGVGVYNYGGTTLYAYDAQGGLIGSLSHSTFGSDFIGIRSDTPIAKAVINGGSYIEEISGLGIVYPVPEPGTATLFGLGAMALIRRRRRPALRARPAIRHRWCLAA